MSTEPPAESAGRVLVVDDRMENRELLSQELEDEDFEVRTAASGAECLEVARDWLPGAFSWTSTCPAWMGSRRVDGSRAVPRLPRRPPIARTPTSGLIPHRWTHRSWPRRSSGVVPLWWGSGHRRWSGGAKQFGPVRGCLASR
jgi:hypothetical protein